MFGSDTIEVVIGLVFVYFVVSLLCSAVTEWIARAIAMRAKTLKEGIRKLLGNENMQQAIFKHPLVTGLSPNAGFAEKVATFWKNWRKGQAKGAAEPEEGDKPGPSALPARTFSVVLLDTLTGEQEMSQQVFEGLGEKINQNKEISADTKKALTTLLKSARSGAEKWEDALTEFRSSVENWFDDAMDRVSGWYKRKTQFIILACALGICLLLNIDTFVIANSLYKDPTLRNSIVAAAETRVEQTVSTNQTPPDIEEIRQELQGLELPLGWAAEPGVPNKIPVDFWGWIIKLLGIAVTALAVSLGAPFWFDLLSKIVNLRSSGNKPAKSGEKDKGEVNLEIKTGT
jgi:hypothetical protein